MVLVQLTRFLESLDDVMFLGTYFTPCKDPRTAHVTHGNYTWAVREAERAVEVKVRQHGSLSHFRSSFQPQSASALLIKSTCFDVVSFNEVSSYPNIATLH